MVRTMLRSQPCRFRCDFTNVSLSHARHDESLVSMQCDVQRATTPAMEYEQRMPVYRIMQLHNIVNCFARCFHAVLRDVPKRFQNITKTHLEDVAVSNFHLAVKAAP